MMVDDQNNKVAPTAKTDEAFEQRVHDAYEQVELSGEAEERILDILLAAQEARAREDEGAQLDAPEEAVSSQPSQGEVLFHPSSGKRNWLQLVLPLAAAFALVAVLGGPALFSNSTSSDGTAQTTSADKTNEAPAKLDEMETQKTSEAPAEDASSSEEEAPQTSFADTELEFDNGISVQIVVDDGIPYAVPAQYVGASLATATMLDGKTATLYELNNADVYIGIVKNGGFYAVSVESDSAFYLVESTSKPKVEAQK